MLNIAEKAARSAGRMMTRALDRLEYLEVLEKAPNDFVTEIDKKSEEEILSQIRKAYPEHSILSEESGEHQGNSSEYRWIVDPIDGTRNYMHGFPHFCISIALEIRGRIEIGVIFDPIRNELFTAERGRGSRLNQRRIRVNSTTKIERAFLATGLPYDQSKDQRLPLSANKLFQKVGDIRISGSAALDLAYVAAGRLDGYWETNLKPWDIAAGSLLVKEAGGFVTDYQGGDTFMVAGNIIAANPKIYSHIYQGINQE